MNTNDNALNKYSNALQTVKAARDEFEKVPLVKQRMALAGPTQRLATVEQVEDHCATQFGGAIQAAGMDFLASIHEEILANEPQWKKDLREQELELERIAQDKADHAQLMAMEAEDNEKAVA